MAFAQLAARLKGPLSIGSSGPDVKILRGTPKQQIPHAAAYEVSGVPVLLEAIEDAQGVRIDVPAREAMPLARDHKRVHGP